MEGELPEGEPQLACVSIHPRLPYHLLILKQALDSHPLPLCDGGGAPYWRELLV